MADQRDLAEELLRLARDDEAAAQALRKVDSVSDAILGFHAQQAVEKALKAALAAAGVDFPFTHDLAHFSELCEEAGLTLPDGLDELDRLTPYAARLRYGASGSSLVDRETALRWASDSIAWAQATVDRLMPSEESDTEGGSGDAPPPSSPG